MVDQGAFPAGWQAFEDQGFVAHVGPVYHRTVEGRRDFAFRAEDKHANLIGIVMGGMLVTFADRALGICAIEAAGGANCVTIQLDTQFIDAGRIGDIIETVNDISERTHLLALNAAIEAAAAGEGGRSFAVVAAEMKLLADQAKGATAQVRTILGEIQRCINSSVMLTEEAVKRAATGKTRTDATVRTIEEMASRVEESAQTFQQVVASTNQQLGIEQVTGALQNIRQASQQTAAGTREVEIASANLTELSQGLLALAERYRL